MIQTPLPRISTEQLKHLAGLHPSIDAALCIAERAHEGQERDGVAYLAHPIEVAHFINVLLGIDDLDIIAAAILHDALEDAPVEIVDEIAEQILSVCGERTLHIVQAVTFTTKEPYVVKVARALAHGGDVAVVKFSDYRHNVSGLKESGDLSDERRARLTKKYASVLDLYEQALDGEDLPEQARAHWIALRDSLIS